MAAKNGVLLAASLVFYGFGEVYYVLLMIASIVFNYGVGLGVAIQKQKRLAFYVLSFGVAINLLVLGYYKYFGFLTDNFNWVITRAGMDAVENAPIHLPIGISFFTFQSISYLVDVYRGRAKVQKNPFYLGLFISLFPQLIAGPIIRYKQFDKQILGRRVTLDGFSSGLRLFCVGLFKKVVIADTAAQIVNQAQAAGLETLYPSTVWFWALCFMIQIFFDFSGYTDMARGLGRMFGFHIPENFKQPYTATSSAKFWQTWHMTLMTWLRDYLLIPLSKLLKGAVGRSLAILLVFVLSGVWHGAGWNFIIFGLIWGLAALFERTDIGKKFLKISPTWIKHIYMHIIKFSTFPLFMAGTQMEVAKIYGKMVFWQTPEQPNLYSFIAHYIDGFTGLVLLVGVIWAWTPIATAKKLDAVINKYSQGRAEPVYMVGALLMFFAAVALIYAQTYSAFIYFRF